MRLGPRIYVLAAAVIHADHEEPARRVVRALGKATRKFHWRDASDPERRKAVSLVAGLEMLHLVAVGAPLDPARQERARRQCLRHLLHELGDMGVSYVLLEARRPKQNLDDLRAVDAFRASDNLPAHLLVDHGQPMKEPLLWAADIGAGAVGSQLAQGELYAELASKVSILEVALT